MESTTLAYLAGCIDCDGSISANRQRRNRADGEVIVSYIVRVTVAQKNRVIPEFCKYALGGNLYYYSAEQRPRTGGWWQWYVAGSNATATLRLVRPYLRLKRQQADLAIQLAEMITRRGRTYSGKPLTAREIEGREQLAAAIRDLNVRRTPSPRVGNQDVTHLSATA